MALPYTPGQVAFRTGEEGPALPGELEGLPVVCCGLHSQLAPACAALSGLRIAYLQLGGGALAVSFSDTVRALRARRLLDVAIAVAPCFDGDFDCVSVASGLLLAKGAGVDAVVCAIGPGIVGTGTSFGHGGVAAASAANAAAALGGRTVIAPRVSNRDPRERHRGVSHHTRDSLRLCLGTLAIAWPEDLAGGDWDARCQAVSVEGWRERCAGLPLAHMGRDATEDPWFFAAAYAGGVLARQLAGQ